MESTQKTFSENMLRLLNLSNDVFVRRAKKTDVDSIMDIFNSISNEDRNF